MQQVQMQVPSLTKINKFIIIAHVALFLLNEVLGKAGALNLVAILGLSSAGLTSGFVFQVITYPFVEHSFMPLLFNSLLIWFIGAELEAKWGKKLYLQFILVSILAGSGMFVLLSSLISNFGAGVALYGLSGIVLAQLLAYGYVYSERVMSFMLIFPMKAKYFCGLIAAIELYMAIFSPQGKAAWCYLAAMGLSFAFLKYKSLAAQGWSISRVKKEMEYEKAKKKLKLIKNDDDKPDYWH